MKVRVEYYHGKPVELETENIAQYDVINGANGSPTRIKVNDDKGRREDDLEYLTISMLLRKPIVLRKGSSDKGAPLEAIISMEHARKITCLGENAQESI